MMEGTRSELRQSRAAIPEWADETPRVVAGMQPRPSLFFRLLATTEIIEVPERDIDYYFYGNVSPRSLTAIETDEAAPFIELLNLSDVDEASPGRVPAASEAEEANRTRLELLARQYVSKKLSAEEEGRLAIVTERVRRLIPRVTIEDFEELERIAVEIKRIGSENSERRKRLRIA
jgi:hypothetical protein